MTRRFMFIGVTTGQSSILPIFPRWRDALGLGADVELAGRDAPLHAPPEIYRTLVREIKDDSANLGGLITAHKIDLFQATRDLFDEVDSYAKLCGEVSCLANRGGRLLGWAKDPISAGLTLDGMLGTAYFGRTGGEVLCLGAGGAGVAITLHLLTRPHPDDRPERVVVVDRSAERLVSLRTLHATLGSTTVAEYVQNDNPQANDRLLEGLPPYSLVINATGMGKDLPGSPLTDAARFPRHGVVWELNYRGPLEFWHQAQAQATARQLRMEDGWRYFIIGWTAVMAEVFQRPITPPEVEELARVADFARPKLA